jgi:hypothetical protein
MRKKNEKTALGPSRPLSKVHNQCLVHISAAAVTWIVSLPPTPGCLPTPPTPPSPLPSPPCPSPASLLQLPLLLELQFVLCSSSDS